MNRIQRLLQLILSSPVLQQVDVQVIKDLARDIPIQDVNIVKHVNVELQMQVDLESVVVYLYGKYDLLKTQRELEKNRLWYTLHSVNGSRAPENHTDPLFVETQDNLTYHINLVQLLKDLRQIIFGRQGKLEQLSVNYRREMQPDE